MTIPTQPVSIHPQLAPRQTSPWEEIFVQAIQNQQQVELAKKKLQQEREQFEITSRLTGEQLEGAKQARLQKKREMDLREEDLVAQDEAGQIFLGNFTRLQDAAGLGEAMAGIKDGRVAGHLLKLLGAAHQLLSPAQGENFTSIGQTPEGKPVLLETHSGKTQVAGPTLRQPGSGVTAALTQKVKLGARNAANAIRQAVALVRTDPNANVLPALSDFAGSAAESRLGAWVPGMKGLAGTLRRKSMSPNQNKFQNLLNIVAHNSVGLLPGTRQSLVLFQNLRESYATASGDPPELRAQKLALLAELGQSLAALAEGQDVSLAHLPGFEEFEPFGLEAAPTRKATPSPAPPAAPNPANYFRP